MKHCRVVIPWETGLHLRCASTLVRIARRFQSDVTLRCGSRAADIRSIMSILTLCAALGSVVDIEVSGDDEQDAVVAIERVFEVENDFVTPPGNSETPRRSGGALPCADEQPDGA